MDKPRIYPGQVWKLKDRYYVVTCVVPYIDDSDRPAEAGVAELECEPHSQEPFRFVPRQVVDRWGYSKESGPTVMLVVEQLRQKGELVGHYGGIITERTVICDRCGEVQRWSSYPHFGHMPPGWSTYLGPVLCPSCTRARKEAKPPASRG